MASPSLTARLASLPAAACALAILTAMLLVPALAAAAPPPGAAACPFDPESGAADSDNDGIPDACDNCRAIPNANQRDTDADGYGNACDADLNNNGMVNFPDLGLFRVAFGTPDPNADFNGDGAVNFADLAAFRTLFGNPPGPTGRIPRLTNRRPVADAGRDQTALLSQTVTLDASGSTDLDGNQLWHYWEIIEAPSGSSSSLDNPRAVRPTLLVDAEGDYTLRLWVNDGAALSEPATVRVSTANSAPVADAGPDQAAAPGTTVILDGSGSADVDGDPLTYAWSLAGQPAGSTATLSSTTEPRTSFLLDLAGKYTARLRVFDGSLWSTADETVITTGNAPPLARAGGDQAISAGDPVGLDGTASSDPEGAPLAYEWSLPVVPAGSTAAVDDPGSATPALTADRPGLYVGQLVVDDGTQASAPDTVVLSTDNSRPVASAGPDQTSTAGTVINLDGSGSADADGDPLLFRWALLYRPAGSSSSLVPASATASLTPDLPGLYIAQLVVSDGVLESTPETVVIEVSPGSDLDSDGDGIADAQERALGTDPFKPDSDGDTFPDGQEVAASSDPLDKTSTPAGSIPPDPAAVAPASIPTAITPLADSTRFLYTGTNPIQTGVSPATIEDRRAAVIRGRVLGSNDSPLPGVRISIRNHPEYGETLSRLDGWFDLVVNGGGVLTLDYTRDGFLPAQRQVQAPWQDFVVADDVVLLAVDSRVTVVDLASATSMQVAQGSPVTDADGTRQATVMFPPGTSAEMVMPDGSTRPLTSISVRATEYTVGEEGPSRMPAALPPTSGYTYAVELSVDEALAAGAETVTFSQPIPFYLDNFLGMPVGVAVPMAYYDRDAACWIPVPDGRVIRILSIDGGSATVDYTGDGVPDDGVAIGLTAAERVQLAQTYPVGTSLWRVPITHFTAYDPNYGVVPVPGSEQPQNPNPTTAGQQNQGQQAAENNSVCGNSVIDCQNQRLREVVTISGTPFTLHYASDRVPGFTATRTIQIPLSGPVVPAVLKRIELTISIAGRTFRESFPPEPNRSYSFTWDGRNALGQVVTGGQVASISIGYAYDGFYALPPNLAESFGAASGQRIPGNIPSRSDVIESQSFWVDLGQPPAGPVAGWSVSAQHGYSLKTRALSLGTGERRNAQALTGVITTIAGTGTPGFSGDGGLATAAQLQSPIGVTAAPDGSVYIADGLNHRIRRVGPDGRISTFAGTGFAGSSGDFGPATAAQINAPLGVAVAPDGSVYISEEVGGRIRRVGLDGTIITVAGTTSGPSSGDGGPADDAQFNVPAAIAVTRDCCLYVAEIRGSRIRLVSPSGQISTVAGTGNFGLSASNGGPATATDLSFTPGLAVGADGSIYITEVGTFAGGNRIRRVGPDGIITTIAGSNAFSSRGFSGDGGPATAALLSDPGYIALGVDGSVYFTEIGGSGFGHRIRRIETDGIITTIAGTGWAGFSGDGGPATEAQLNNPLGISVAADGSVYFADRRNHRVRRIALAGPGFSSGEIPVPDSDGAEIFVFDRDGRHLRTVSSLTKSTLLEFSYDSRGALTAITDGDGNRTTIQRNSAGHPTAIVAPDGQRTELGVDAGGYLATITNPAGEQLAMTYSAGGLLETFTDARGLVSIYSYDDVGRFRQAASPDTAGQRLVLGESTRNFEVRRTSAAGRETRYLTENLPIGDQRRTTFFPDGSRTVVTVGTDGRTRTTLPDGSATDLVEGPDPRFSMQAPVATSLTTTRGSRVSVAQTSRTATLANPQDPLSLTSLAEISTLNGRPTARTYNAATRTWVTTAPTGRTQTQTTDAQGRPTLFQIPGLAPLTQSYDARGRLETVSNGTRTTVLGYDSSGYPATATDPLGRVTESSYDPVGRETRRTLPGGREILFAYDANGNLTSLTPPGRPAHAFTYTAGNRLASYVPPAVPGGGPTTYSYNADRDLVRVDYPGGRSLVNIYDAAGRLASAQIGRGSYGYHYQAGTGLLARITDPQGGALDYAYEGGLLTQVQRSGTVPGTIAYGYDNDFRVMSISVNGSPVSFGYDADGLLTTAGAMTLTYDPGNALLTGTTLGVVTDEYTYNDVGEVATYTARANGTVVFSVVYTRDQLGRITEKAETIQGEATTWSYSYDLAGRLSQVRKDGTLTAVYTYDDNGNRLTKTGPGINEAGTYDDQDRLRTYAGATYAYRPSGELLSKTIGGQTTTYDYDELGNLVGVQTPDGTDIDYLIDGQNRRIGRRVDGSLVQGFLYQDQLRPAAELDGDGNVTSRFVYGARVNVPEYMIRDGVAYRILTDQVGSPRLVISALDGRIVQAITYDEFGAVMSNSNPDFQPFGFQGGLADSETGLIRFGRRDYLPGPGRWAARDPSGFLAGSANLYLAVGANPITQFDPDGQVCLSTVGTGAALALSGAVLFAGSASTGFLPGVAVGGSAVGAGFVTTFVGLLAPACTREIQDLTEELVGTTLLSPLVPIGRAVGEVAGRCTAP